MGIRLIGYILTIVGIILAGAALYFGTHKDVPLVFSPTQMMGSLWSDYKLGYLEDNRAVDRQRDNVTTSEGQSYTMLRAVWMGDKETFDNAWQWTKDNLDRPNDRLSSWLFGERADGSYGILTEQGGYNSASDAEVDMALALIFGYARWQDEMYLGDAQALLRDIWDKEVLLVGGRPYLAANDLEKFSPNETAIVNPSYLAPYAYRIFELVDPGRDWDGLVATSYEVIEKSLSEDGLPPDWARIDKRTGAVIPAGSELSDDFSYDALRTPWRLALDYEWYGDERAAKVLKKMRALREEWSENGKIVPRARDGSAVGPEAPALYGGVIGYFVVAEPTLARRVYEEKIQFLYDPGVNRFKERLSYYDDNWVWFGIGLYNRLLPNLATSLERTTAQRP
jgi:endo-1,4-beta-D-glucanase Y